VYLVGASVKPPHPPCRRFSSWSRHLLEENKKILLSQLCCCNISSYSFVAFFFQSAYTWCRAAESVDGGREGFCLCVRLWGDLVLNSGV